MRTVTKPEGFEHYRTSAELAKFLGIAKRTVLRWHTDEKIRCSVNLPNGTRLYGPGDCQAAMEYKLSLTPSARASSRRIT